MGETHGLERLKRGTKIRATVEGAATAVNHEVRRARNVLRPFLQIGEPLRRRAGTMIDRAGNVAALEQKVRRDAYDGWPVGDWSGEFFDKSRGLDRFRGSPRIRDGGGSRSRD